MALDYTNLQRAIQRLKEFEQWNGYIKSRNTTSHEYSENAVADDEYIELIQDFYDAAQQLLQALQDTKV